MYNKTIKNIAKSVSVSLLTIIGLVSCYDSGFEPFEPPTGNVNNIQPNTLFTTSTEATDNLSIVFRSYSTDAASYAWDFGDGNTSDIANPNHTYATGGLYEVTLTTESSDGLIATNSSQVAPISVEFISAQVDSEVSFTNSSTGVQSLSWDFGDGSDSVTWNVVEGTTDDSDYNPIYIYKTADTFEVTLTAISYLGVEVAVTKNIEDLILSTVPDFTFKTSGLKADFTDASLLAETHSWDFGDGNTSKELNPSHTYATKGTYNVTLTTTNEANVSKSITKPVPVGGVDPTFAVVVLNSTANDWTEETGDNADAWDMTPNSTIKDNTGTEVDSPYRAIWNNSDLADWLADADNCGDADEQPGSSSDGNKFGSNAGGGRGVKINEACRRLYQKVVVEPGVEYTFTIDSRSEAEGVNSEVFILNKDIISEDAINTETEREINADAYYLIDNDFNASKASTSNDTFTTTTFTFKASANFVIIYVRASAAVDGSNEVFYDNIDIITPGL